MSLSCIWKGAGDAFKRESLQDDCVQVRVVVDQYMFGVLFYGSKSELVTLNNNVNGLLYRNNLQKKLIALG